jgi:hypothetical protein
MPKYETKKIPVKKKRQKKKQASQCESPKPRLTIPTHNPWNSSKFNLKS